MKYLISIFFFFTFSIGYSQYPPQVGLPGCTAIAGNSSQFVAWASQCTIYRGLMYIDSPSLGYASSGDSSMAIGPADHNTVSLGDSGIADVMFPGFLYDGPGADFAVFENGFANPLNDSQAFLELAFVEVSSDGINYTRFPSQSLTQTNVQIPGSGVYMYANLLSNLAGKYIGGYGTPFDLNELSGTPGLDISHITHVRVIDVIGDISGRHSTRDSSDRIINDPYPTNFATGGFDLDAVGAIHIAGDAGITKLNSDLDFRLFPNPATENISLEINDCPLGTTALVTTASGTIVDKYNLKDHNDLSCGSWSPGLYYFFIHLPNGIQCVQKIVKY